MVSCRLEGELGFFTHLSYLLIYFGAAMNMAASSAAGHREVAVCMEVPEEDTVSALGMVLG